MARSLRVIGPGPGGAGWDGSQGREGARRFGAYLRRLRRQRKKSLEVISGLAGMSLPTLHRTEWGKRDVTVVEVVALARALDCSVVELAGVALGAVVAPSAEAERRRR